MFVCASFSAKKNLRSRPRQYVLGLCANRGFRELFEDVGERGRDLDLLRTVVGIVRDRHGSLQRVGKLLRPESSSVLTASGREAGSERRGGTGFEDARA